MSHESQSVLATMRKLCDLPRCSKCKSADLLPRGVDVGTLGDSFRRCVPCGYMTAFPIQASDVEKFGRYHLCANCCKVGRVAAYVLHGNFTDDCPVDAGEKQTKFAPLYCGYVVNGEVDCGEPAVTMLDADTPGCKKHGKVTNG